MDTRRGGRLIQAGSLPARRSPLHDGYLVQNPWLRWYLRATDALLRRVVGERTPQSNSTARRVLVAIGGHAGDAILATASLDLLHSLVPGIELGIVMPSWSRVVLEGDARIQRIHVVDHWRLNRASIGMREKVAHYAQTARNAIADIRAQHYDVGIDLYPFYPNMAGVFWRAGIPRRFGFASGGRAALRDSAMAWTSEEQHVAARQTALVRAVMGMKDATDALPASTLPSPAATVVERMATLFARLGVTGPYIVLHAGSGLRKKEWPGHSWRGLAQHLDERGYQMVLTGVGVEERAQADRIAANVPHCTTLVDQIDWQTLCAVVSGATAVVSGDTSVAHLAAARGTPRVVIFSGINSVHEWHPIGARGPQVILQHPIACAPCYRRDGCAAMTCVNGVTVDDVVSALDTMMGVDRNGRSPTVFDA